MNQLTITPNVQTMTSREIAELTDKRHDHVMRDIRKLKEQLGSMFVGYPQMWGHPQNGQTYEEFALDKDTTLTLLLGYDAVARMKVVKRWQELEAKEQAFDPASLSRMDILKLAMQTEEERLRLEQEKHKLEQQIETEAPRVAFAKQVEIAPDAISVAQAAKILGTGQQRLFAFLREIGWITRYNEPYQEKIEAGLLDVKLGNWQHPDHGLKQSVTSLITGKGLAKLQPLWEKHKGRAA